MLDKSESGQLKRPTYWKGGSRKCPDTNRQQNYNHKKTKPEFTAIELANLFF